MVVKGDLRDMDLTSIIAVNCNQMNQARLVIRHEDREAIIFFQDGNIVHMSLESLEGEQVIQEVLGWEDGVFELERDVPSPKRTVSAGWSELLLQGMQRLDERAALGGHEDQEILWESPPASGESEMGSTTQRRNKDMESIEEEVHAHEGNKAVQEGEAEAAEDMTRVSSSPDTAEEVDRAAHLKALADALFRMGLDHGLSPDQAVLQASAASLPPFVTDEARREIRELLLEVYRESLNEQLDEQAEELREAMMLEEDEANGGK
ncbi:MAG: DUF4388 domain-containing protein [Anaerolineae bacterium]|nr:DUF4388 domain-containing protein [Anaerolineae bacterium]NIN95762.1 DUF4388 domain-containing protein [Anaerolineae bacterium]NIQ78737.1 DUF4388 domain-containing protein [Anaerolineae bacterium]